MKTVEQQIAEHFCEKFEKNLRDYENRMKDLLKKDCVMDKKKWEPKKAPNPCHK